MRIVEGAEGPGPGDELRELSQLTQPDVRMSFIGLRDGGVTRRISQEDRHEQIAAVELHGGVPEGIRVQFDTARNAYLYAWFVYRFHVVAEQLAFSTLELALRTRLIDAELLDQEGQECQVLPPRCPGDAPRVKLKRATLSRLLEIAKETGLVSNERLELRVAWALLLAAERESTDRIQEMRKQGLSEMVISDEALTPNEEELSYDWIRHFARTIPRVRNHYAHGSTALHANVLWTFQVVQQLINQLFLGAE